MFKFTGRRLDRNKTKQTKDRIEEEYNECVKCGGDYKRADVNINADLVFFHDGSDDCIHKTPFVGLK